MVDCQTNYTQQLAVLLRPMGDRQVSQDMLSW